MVHVELCKKKKKNEEVGILVVTRGGAKTGGYFEHGEGSVKKLDKNIIKAPQPPPKFDAPQHK
jgi:hypothetical protein